MYFQVWQKFFVPLHSLNFGIGGDQTQHVLWRLQNGELDNFSPKVSSNITFIFIIYFILNYFSANITFIFI